MTIPRVMGLYEMNDEVFIRSKPVVELEDYRTGQKEISNKSLVRIDSLSDISFTLDWSDKQEATIEIRNGQGEIVEVTLNREADEVVVSRGNSGETSFHPDFRNDHRAPYTFKLQTRVRLLIDVSSIEIFIDEGALVMTELFFPSMPFDTIRISPEPIEMTTYSLRSIWGNAETSK